MKVRLTHIITFVAILAFAFLIYTFVIGDKKPAPHEKALSAVVPKADAKDFRELAAEMILAERGENFDYSHLGFIPVRDTPPWEDGTRNELTYYDRLNKVTHKEIPKGSFFLFFEPFAVHTWKVEVGHTHTFEPFYSDSGDIESVNFGGDLYDPDDPNTYKEMYDVLSEKYGSSIKGTYGLIPVTDNQAVAKRILIDDFPMVLLLKPE